MRETPKVGERVAFYYHIAGVLARAVGEVVDTHPSGTVIIRASDGEESEEFWGTRHQCRRLVKKPRQRVWIRADRLNAYKNDGEHFRTIEPADKKGWVSFLEELPKKNPEVPR